MNMRKITSLTTLISFVLLMITSIVLYIVPAGRVAFWADYRLWGLSKADWNAVHINLGVLMLVAIILHVYYNWKPMLSYMRNKSRQLRVFTLDFNISLIVTLAVFFGTLAGIPPLSSIIDFGVELSEQANQFYGEPPYGHAELSSLTVFAGKIEADLDASLAALKFAGVVVASPKNTVLEIATANATSPQHIYEIIKPVEEVDVVSEMPEETPTGTGKKTLLQICELYQLDQVKIVQELAKQGLKVSLEQTMKANATANSLEPSDIYMAIYKLINR